MNTLSCNLHLMMVPFYNPTPQRFKILIEKKAFPSDYHVVTTQIQFHGYKVEDALIEIAPREGEDHLRDEDIEEVIRKEGDSIALILFSGIQYYTGQFFDLATIARLGKEYGCRVGFDLAHAVGNVPVQLHDWDVDFACWCTYKYMNSGPGAIAGCFVHEKHGKVTFAESTQDSQFKQVVPLRLGGWWGHRSSDRFVMAPSFIPGEGADGFRLSNPPVVAVACVQASLELFDRVR